jgi:hypothetical protein
MVCNRDIFEVPVWRNAWLNQGEEGRSVARRDAPAGRSGIRSVKPFPTYFGIS